MIGTFFSASYANALVLSISLAFACCIVITITQIFKTWVAFKLGDSTPIENGFLSLNPLDHIDPIGAFCLLFFGLGWGKTVPINPLNIHGRFRNLKIFTAYMSDIIAYIVIGIISMVFLALLFDKNIIGISLYQLMYKGLSYQTLHYAYPGYSSISIALGFIAICSLYLSITIGTLQCIIDGFHLGSMFIYSHKAERSTTTEVVLVLLPIVALLLLAGPLRYFIMRSIATVSIFLTNLIGL